MKQLIDAILAALFVFGLSACAGSGAPTETANPEQILAEKGFTRGKEINQLMNFQIRGWQYVDRQNVILEDGPSRRYLVTLAAPCHPLQNAYSIAFTSKVNTVTRNDRLLVRQAPGHPMTCYIDRLYELEKLAKEN